MKVTILAAAFAIAFAPFPAMADSKKAAPTNPATHHHGAPGNTPGFTDEAHGAAPAGGCAGCDGGQHGIGNVPGQNPDNNPRVGEPGFRDQIGTVHNGLAHNDH